MSTPAIQVANKITIDQNKSFTYTTNSDYFAKHNLICFFVRHAPHAKNPQQQNGFLNFYSSKTFAKVKQVVVPNHNRYCVIDDDNLAVFQTKIFEKGDLNPQVQIFNLEKLDFTASYTLPLKTIRRRYQTLEHVRYCACDANRRDSRIPTPCCWVEYDEISKTQLKKLIPINSEEFIFELWDPVVKPVNKTIFQIWNTKTNKIQDLDFAVNVDTIKNGLISVDVQLQREAGVYPYSFYKNGKTYVLLNTVPGFSVQNDMESDSLNKFQNMIVLLDFSDSSNPKVLAKTKLKNNPPNKHKLKLFIDVQNEFLGVNSNSSTAEIYNLFTLEYIKKFTYPREYLIESIGFTKYTVTVAAVDYNRKITHDQKYNKYKTDYIQVFVNNIQSGLRVGKFIHALEGHITTSSDDPPEIPLLTYISNDDSDILLLGIYFKNWIADKEINDLILAQATKSTPNIGSENTGKQFDGWNDNGIEWNPKYICGCGQYLEKRTEFLKEYVVKKSYSKLEKPFCHNCVRDNVFWACNTCQYNICSGCRSEELGQVLPSQPNCKNGHPLKAKKYNNIVPCVSCENNAVSVFNCETCQSNQCLKCNEPADWKVCRKTHEFLPHPTSQSCQRCNQKSSSKIQYKCTIDDSVFCQKCMISEQEDMLIDPQSLRPVCIANHYMQVQKSTSKCILCTPKENDYNEDRFRFKCTPCDLSLCQRHAPFHTDNLLCQSLHQMKLEPILKGKCSTCKKQQKYQYNCPCNGSICEVCLNVEPRPLSERKFIEQEMNRSCPKGHFLFLTANTKQVNENALLGIGMDDGDEQQSEQDKKANQKTGNVCKRCNNNCRKANKFMWTCACQYIVCVDCKPTVPSDIICKDGKVCVTQTMKRDQRCIGCKDSNCPSKNTYGCDNFGQNHYYCLECLPQKRPKLTLQIIASKKKKLQEFQQQFGSEKEKLEERIMEINEYPRCEKNNHIMGLDIRPAGQTCSKCQKNNKLSHRCGCTIYCYECVQPYNDSVWCNDCEKGMVPFKSDFTCYTCQKSFLNQKGNMCPCNKKICTNCIPAIDRDQAQIEQIKEKLKQEKIQKEKELKEQKKRDNLAIEIEGTQNLFTDKMIKCPDGHNFSMGVTGSHAIPNCFNCSKKIDQNQVANNKFIFYECNPCKIAVCFDCTQGPFSEIIPCKKGHQMQFFKDLQQNNCMLCGGCAKNVQYKCKQCYRDTICNKCIVQKSIRDQIGEVIFSKKPMQQDQPQVEQQQQQQQQQPVLQQQPVIQQQQQQPVVQQQQQQPVVQQQQQQPVVQQQQQPVLQQQQQQEQTVVPQQQQQAVKSEPRFVQSEQDELEKCNKGHTMSVIVVSDTYLPYRKCFNCKQVGCKDSQVGKNGYLYHYCNDCDSYLCVKCTGGFYTEIVPCKSGHKTVYYDDEQQGNCALCGGCAKNIQYKCPESVCYRDNFCTNCIPLRSVASKQDRMPAQEEQPVQQQQVKQVEQVQKQSRYVQNEQDPMEKCQEGHQMAISVVSDTYMPYRKCFNCKRKDCREKSIGNNKFLLYGCKECDVYLCMQCTGGTFTEVVPCQKGHKTVYYDEPIQGNCALCGGCAPNIQYKCPEGSCYRDHFCTNCIPLVSVSSKPERQPEQQDQPVQQQQQQVNQEEQVQKPARFVQNEQDPMEKCKEGHQMAISVVSDTYMPYKQCFNCERKDCREKSIGNNKFLLYNCKECDVYLCMLCSGGTFTEVVPCQKGHKTVYYDDPIQGNCNLCGGCAPNIQYKCPEGSCYRDHFCNNCIPLVSVSSKPERPAMKTKPDIVDDQVQQQQEIIKSEPRFTQSDNDKMETCQEGHVMSLCSLSSAYLPYRQCYNCEKKNCNQKPVGKGNYLLYKCGECDVYLCMDCSGGTFTEIVPCQKGHKTVYYDDPQQGNCALCGGCAKNIQYKCPEKSCYRDHFCTECIPLVSVGSKQEKAPKFEQKEYVQLEEHQMTQCPKNHTMTIAVLGDSYISDRQCHKCKRVDCKEKPIGNNKGYALYQCKTCNIYECMICSQGTFTEIFPCSQGHKTKFLHSADQGNCALCGGCALNIQYKCPEGSCYRDHYCNECVPLRSILEKKPENEVVIPLVQARFTQSSQDQMEQCDKGHNYALTVLSDFKVCSNCEQKECQQSKIGNNKYLYYYCKDCKEYLCMSCTGGTFTEIVPCKSGHKTEYFDIPQQGNCALCGGCAKNIQYKCPESGCYRDHFCTNCIPLVSISSKTARAPKFVQTEYVQKDEHKMVQCPKQHNMVITAINKSYIEDKKCHKCNRKNCQEKEIEGKGFALYECTTCKIYECMICSQGAFTEIIPCKKGHKTKFLHNAEQGNCALCGGCAPNIQYKCPEGSCYRDHFCNKCFPLRTILEKKPENEVVIPYVQARFTQNDADVMELCQKGHVMAINVYSQYQLEDRKCFNCERRNCKEKAVSNKGFMMFNCKECDEYLCLQCTGGTFTEIIPCKKGHKTVYEDDEIQGNCSMCGGCAKNIQYKCPDSGCYRETYCNICFPLISVAAKPERAPKFVQTEFVQKDEHQMVQCPKEHTMIVSVVGESYIDNKYCHKCKRSNCKEQVIEKKGYALYECTSCRIYECMVCSQGLFSEIFPCKKGHKTIFDTYPAQGNCAMCGGCARNIQYKCKDCYRDTFCTNCVPVRSIIEKKEVQEEECKQEQQQKEYEQEKCKQGHNLAMKTISETYISYDKCVRCDKVADTRSFTNDYNQVQYIVMYCKPCDEIVCLECTQGPFKEIMPCREGHKCEFLEIPDQGNCIICNGCAPNIQYKCKEDTGACYRDTYCTNCIPVQSIVDKK